MARSVAPGADKMARAGHPGGAADSSKPALAVAAATVTQMSDPAEKWRHRCLLARQRREEQVSANHFPSSTAIYANANSLHHASHNHTLCRSDGGRRSRRHSSRHEPKHPTVPLVTTIEDVEMRAFETADQAAGSAAAMLADGERLSRLWRYVFAQMLDDSTNVLHHVGVAAAARMWSGAPRRHRRHPGGRRICAMAEYLARRDVWTVPA
jgi:hypothetical protein